MKLQKIDNFKTRPYKECTDAKYDDHHAELFNPYTGEVYLEDVMPDTISLIRKDLSYNRFKGYYDKTDSAYDSSNVGYGDYVYNW